MSKKTVSFSVPAKAAPAGASAGAAQKRAAADSVSDAHSDDWVSDRHAPDAAEAMRATAPSLMLDLAAERGLFEVILLGMLAPAALGFFWFVNAMAGRARF